MQKAFITILLFLYLPFAYPQTRQYDSLKNLISLAKDDSTKFYETADFLWKYLYSYPDSATRYIQENILLAKKMNSDSALYLAYVQYSELEFRNGNFSSALQYTLQSLKPAERRNDFIAICEVHFTLADIFKETGDFDKSLENLNKAKSILESKLKPGSGQEKNNQVIGHYAFCLELLAQTFEKFDRLDSALKYANNTISFLKRMRQWLTPSDTLFFSRSLAPVMGNIYSKRGDYSIALSYFRSGAALAIRDDLKGDLMDNYSGAAITFKRMGQPDSSVFYANKVLEISEVAHNIIVKLDALNLLTEIYKSKHNTDSLAKYLELTIETKDRLFSKKSLMEIQNITFNEEIKQKEIIEKQQQRENRLRMYVLAGLLFVVLLIAGILYRNNQNKQKAKLKIEKAYEELKTTQAQLIQSEKMASLGEMTAGIAHEIQNPLNFVNNFSEVNMELLKEVKNEIDKGNFNEARSMTDDIIDNEEKIIRHGKRADSIVKRMLQHSRTNSGQKESTDINLLTDEYLRLSYQGLRAKDSSFNATIKTDFDPSIGKINIVRQDIGRVLLNMFNNAFYAVAKAPRPPEEGVKYEPSVTVSTRIVNSPSGVRDVEIRIADNGSGIPQKILDKIFQPFFTTKPAGQGTGLGLSLSYDIVKAHGGEIKVETSEGEGSTFIIFLPSNKT